jgi:AAA15 family ATPase/GTPase
MRSNLRAWKQKAVAKLKNNPKTINQLDKYMFMIYDINTGDLDLESLQDKPQHESKSKALFPATKLSSGTQRAALMIERTLRAVLMI